MPCRHGDKSTKPQSRKTWHIGTKENLTQQEEPIYNEITLQSPTEKEPGSQSLSNKCTLPKSVRPKTYYPTTHIYTNVSLPMDTYSTITPPEVSGDSIKISTIKTPNLEPTLHNITPNSEEVIIEAIYAQVKKKPRTFPTLIGDNPSPVSSKPSSNSQTTQHKDTSVSAKVQVLPTIPPQVLPKPQVIKSRDLDSTGVTHTKVTPIVPHKPLQLLPHKISTPTMDGDIANSEVEGSVKDKPLNVHLQPGESTSQVIYTSHIVIVLL